MLFWCLIYFGWYVQFVILFYARPDCTLYVVEQSPISAQIMPLFLKMYLLLLPIQFHDSDYARDFLCNEFYQFLPTLLLRVAIKQMSGVDSSDRQQSNYLMQTTSS